MADPALQWPQEIANVRSWARDQYQTGAFVQASVLANTDHQGVVKPVALMPDAHVGLGACIGSVVATAGTILPASVGVDIGCGMSAVRLDYTGSDLPDDLDPMLSALAIAVPPTAHGTRVQSRGAAKRLEQFKESPSGMADMGRAISQLGTLGSGNHFLEVSLDRQDRVWIVVHSGSRGVGNYLARQHIKAAAAADPDAPSKDLAAFREGTPEFESYVADMLWCQDYAYLNREMMLESAAGVFRTHIDSYRWYDIKDRIRCHHNYAEREEHNGRQVWITRKGAIRARSGDRGIIPGSMGASTFLVSGLGNPDSYFSASHGAGRTMSRRKARENLDVNQMRNDMIGCTWLSDKAEALLDEAPLAYKDIDKVMAWQSDLCTVDDELFAILNYKGT